MPRSPLLSKPTPEDLAFSILPAFAAMMHPDLEPARHHRLLCRKLADVEAGRCKRLMVFLPPGSAKSHYANVMFSAWFMGRNPRSALLVCSASGDLASQWGRRVRNLVAQPLFRTIFGTGLSLDNAAADRWATTHGGLYFAAGVGATIVGRRADLAVLDDPVADRQHADNAAEREKLWQWYKWDFWTRLKPGAAVVLIMCMTGDTPVLMADGTEKNLRDIQPGDAVATYRDGALSTSKVLNWINHGPDWVYEIRTTSGKIVKANERHPFLVRVGEDLKWLRLRDLRQGHEIVRVNGESGRAKPAPGKAATSRFPLAATALLTTTKNAGRTAFGRLRSIMPRGGRLASSIVTASPLKNSTVCTKSRAACARSVGNLRETMSALIGAGSSAWTIAMTGAAFAHCFATTATSPPVTSRRLTRLSLWQNTSGFTLDRIAEIRPAGSEDVFDIEVEGTENFIANGLVSHNTRWNEDDLAGRLLADMAAGGESWDVISIPALAEAADPLGRSVGEPLWPEWFTDSMFVEAQRNARSWSALYQQRPMPETGDYFKSEWFHSYSKLPDRATLRIYGGSDYAVTQDGGDFTCHVVVALDSEGRLYLVDCWRGQTDSAAWVEAFCDLVVKWKPIGWAEEMGQIKSGVGPWLTRRQRERGAYVHREAFPTRGDKSIRCQSFRGRAALDGVYLPIGVPWAAQLQTELLGFPAAAHDDCVDACGLVGQLLDHMLAGARPKAAQVGRRDGWDKAFAGDDSSDSWKVA